MPLIERILSTTLTTIIDTSQTTVACRLNVEQLTHPNKFTTLLLHKLDMSGRGRGGKVCIFIV